MLGNIYVNKIHAKQCLYIISLYYREGSSHAFNFFVVSKGILISKQLWKGFSIEQLAMDSYTLLSKQKNSI